MAIPSSIQSARELSQAFSSFSELSEQLIASYRSMEQQTEHLAQALRVATHERALQSEQTQQISNRLRVLLDALPAGVVVLDGAGYVQDCNPAAAELLGEPLRGQLWRDVIARSFAPRPDDGHDISLHNGRRVNLSTNALGDESGQIVLLTDVTSTRTLQDKVHQYERESALGDMAAALAHQIRTPLSAAVLYTGHLKQVQLPYEDRARVADKILSRLRYMEGLVHDMLLLARAESGAGEGLSVSALLEELEEIAQPQMRERGITLVVCDESQCCWVRGQRYLLVSALENLVNNAVQSIAGPGQVALHARVEQAGWIDIAVVDTGCGIPESLQRRIGEPFFTTRAQGHGLGLAVVNAVAKAHQGSFNFKSEAGVGSTFVVRLPVYNAGPGEARTA